MSTSRPNGADDRKTPGTNGRVHTGRADTDAQLSMGGGEPRSDYGAGGAAGARRKRRRQRPQHGKRPRPHEQHRTVASGRLDVTTRERVFQSVEGLLRQIREQADETSHWTEDELREITQTVTSFTKSLEQEHDPISERARLEYQRIREKLSQALNKAGQAARETAGGF
jgi:hypothetical protein